MLGTAIANENAAARNPRGGAPRGYGSLAYAATLVAECDALDLDASGSVAIRSRIPNTSLYDAHAVHPYLCCEQWHNLTLDLDRLSADFVSFTAVSDPFSGLEESALAAKFDHVRAFKMHHVADLCALRPRPGHSQEARRSLRRIQVLRRDDANDWSTAWIELYRGLCARRGLMSGAGPLNAATLAAQLRLPDMRVYAAAIEGRICSMALWMINGNIAHYHLAASNEEGYAAAAGYGLMQAALEDFANDGLGWACLGSVPGDGTGYPGLLHFKRGWATDSFPVFICGRIFQPALYAQLSAARARADYFPAYRSIEHNNVPRDF